ncbi:hypothetical protein GCM10023149_34270 [Mucilaginibacter gynuensis]|uniref:Uncharacterized protein n=1 Tax=Mucilaginibacter gynuensis TaxID=1302236 RepID=A0ABP8GTS0_9SPHI
MIKWFTYIILLLVLLPCLSIAEIKNGSKHSFLHEYNIRLLFTQQLRGDTIINKKTKKQREEDEKNQIKEIAKAKRQTKPEKVDDDTEDKKKKRERRPDGMERPPEIIRRNGG